MVMTEQDKAFYDYIEFERQKQKAILESLNNIFMPKPETIAKFILWLFAPKKVKYK